MQNKRNSRITIDDDLYNDIEISRNKNYDKIVSNNIGTYLFEKALAKSIFVYVKDKNSKSKASVGPCVIP